MRKLLALIVVLVAVALVSPWFVGMKAKTELEGLVARSFSEDNQKSFHLRAELKDYKRGWFKSTAILALTTVSPEQAAINNKTMSFKVSIHHGPISFQNGRPRFGWGVAHLEPSLPAALDTMLNMAFPKDAPRPRFDATVTLNFTGSSNVLVEMPAFSYKGGLAMGGASLDWKGLRSNWDLNSSQDKLVGDFELVGIEGAGGPASLKVDPIRFSVNVAKYKPNSLIWLGKTSFSMDGYSLTVTPDHNYAMSGLSMESTSSVSGKTLSGPLTMKLGKLIINSFTSGPAELQCNLSKLDVDSYEAFVVEINKLKPDADAKDFAETTLPLVKTGAEFSVDKFSLEVPEGTLTAQAKLTLPANPDVKNVNSEAAAIIKTAVLDATASAPVALVSKSIAKWKSDIMKAQQKSAMGEQGATAPLTNDQIESQAKADTEQTLAANVQNGYLILKDDQYSVHLTLKEGQLLANDKQLLDLTTLLPSASNPARLNKAAAR